MFLKNRNISSKIKRSKVTDYAALSGHSKIDKNDLNDKCQRNEGDFCNTVKPVLGGHSKIDKSKVLKTNGSLMEVESIAECSLGAFCNTFDLH